MNKYSIQCRTCPNLTSKAYARKHDGMCKACNDPDDGERELRIMETYGSYAAYQCEEDHHGNPDY